MLLAASSSSTGRSQLFLITLPTGAVEKIPLHDNGAYLVAGSDGCAYLGTFRGRLLRFDPAQRALVDLMPPVPDTGVTAAHAAANGRLYFGLTPGLIVEITPETGEAAAYRIATPASSAQVCAFADLPDGRIVAFLYGEQHTALALSAGLTAPEYFDLPGLIGERDVQQVVPLADDLLLIGTRPGRRLFRLSATTLQVVAPLSPLPDDDAVYCLQRAGEHLLASGVSGALYRREEDGWEPLGIPMPDEPLHFAALPDGRLAGVAYHGRLVQSTTDQRMYQVTVLPTRETDGLAIRAMGMSPDRKLYFSFAENMRLGRWDPDEDDLCECFVAAPFHGEVSALGFAGERLLIGFADACGVTAYYPELPYRLLENPRFLGRAGADPRRPLGPMVHHGNDVYFAAAALDRYCDGAIVRVNPLDHEVTLFAAVIPGQNLTSLVADRLSGLLIAGGSRHAVGNVPVGPARLALWSPYTEETVRLLTPFADACLLRVWAAEGGRVYVTDGGTRLAILSSDGDILTTGDFPLGTITSLATNQDGKLYGLAGGWMFHLDAEAQCVERLVEAEGALLTEVRRGLFAFANGGRLHTVQLW